MLRWRCKREGYLINEKEFRKVIDELKNISLVMEHFKCSKNTIRNYLKKFEIKTPCGFYSTGSKVGRPIGTPCSDKQKSLMSEKFSGSSNPFFGKKHTKETKEKMSANHADFSGDKNPFKKSLSIDGNRERHRQRCLKIWKSRDKEWRKVFSEKLSKAIANSENFKSPNFHKNHKSGYFSSSKCGQVFFRSSWEERLCIALDGDEDVEAFNLEEFCIDYQDDNLTRYTRIDFTILKKSGKKYMIEVKPKSLVDSNSLKIESMRDFSNKNGYAFSVWGLEEIEEYEKTSRLDG